MMNIDAEMAVYQFVKEIAEAYCSECEKGQKAEEVCSTCELIGFVHWANPQP